MATSSDRFESRSSPADHNVEGEHKVISVLFTDVVNYTSLAEKLDLEAVREIINNHFNMLTEAVETYRGTVDQLLGDGMVAFFGAPLAYEDHAQRACYAALGMQEAMQQYGEDIREKYGVEFQIRIGINSGEVLVGPVGSDHHAEYLAIGDTVNLASRMENASRPGGILVSENVHSLTNDYFRFEPIGEIGVKGKERPVAAYRLIRALETDRRFDAAVARGLSRFVGRDEEIEILRQTFAQAQRGRGQIMGIWGEPGIGKSRLLREFRLNINMENFTYLEGRCLHYGSMSPFKPLVDIVKAYFAIEEGDLESHIRDRMAEKLRQLDEGLVEYLPFICEVLSFKCEDERYLRMENQYKRSKLFEGLAQLLHQEASARPLIVAVEDLHWIDKASEEFLTYLVKGLSNSRILLILLYRPEYASPWIDLPNYADVHLNQLALANCEEFLQSLSANLEPGPELRSLVLSRAGGNPLFMEEFVRTLMDHGAICQDEKYYDLDTLAHTIKLPDTIQGIIAARIDRLSEVLKNTLHVASVIGRDFSYPVLQNVTQLPDVLKSQLDTMQQLEFIVRKDDAPEMECVFKHALIQEVAYDSLLQVRRKELHRSIGLAIERLYSNRLEEFAEVLAYHFQRGSSPDRAVEYLLRSGRKALNRYAIEEASQFYEQAFDIVSNKAGEAREEQLALLNIVLEWAEVFYYQGRLRALAELLERHESLAAAVGDKYSHAMLLGWLGISFHILGRSKESYRCLRRALVLAEESGQPKAIAYVCAWLSWACCQYGATDEGIAYGEKAMAISLDIEANDYPYVKSLGGMGFVAGYTGRTQKAYECGQRLLEFGKERGNLRGQALGHWILALYYMHTGEMEASIEECRQGIGLNPDPFYLEMLRFGLGHVCVFAGRLREAEDAIGQVISYSQKYGGECMEWPATAMLGLNFIARGRMTKGLRMISGLNSVVVINEVKLTHAIIEFCYGKVYAQLACPAAPMKVSLLIRNLGFILWHAPFAARKAVHHFREAARICRDCGYDVWMGMVYLELGRLYQQKGKKELARENLLAAAELSRECGAMNSVAQAENLLKSLETSGGR